MTMKKVLMALLGFAVLGAFLSAAPRPAAARVSELTGAGASFPYPLYSQWFHSYQQATGVRVNYQSVGSGAGIRQVTAGTVDFGGSDAVLTAEQLAERNLVQFPTVAGAVAVVYNVPGTGTGLKLTSQNVADIFLGRITRWNDPKITADNPGVTLPDRPIVVCRRADGSGTTNLFSLYLSAVSADWKEQVGYGTSLSWPVGLGGRGNEGVAGLVSSITGGIGYVELAYALQNQLTYAAVGNREGNFILPTIATTRAAAAQADVPDDFNVDFTYEKGADSYPIAGFTYIMVRRDLAGDKLAGVIRLIEWVFANGDGQADNLHYVPLPQSLKDRILAALGNI